VSGSVISRSESGAPPAGLIVTVLVPISPTGCDPPFGPRPRAHRPRIPSVDCIFYHVVAPEGWAIQPDAAQSRKAGSNEAQIGRPVRPFA
jgi:hypothetical protein